MKSNLTRTLNKQAKPEIDLSLVHMTLPNMVLNASMIDVIGNWDNTDHFLIYLKNGSKLKFKNIDPIKGIHMYMAALSGQATDYRTFEIDSAGYGNGGRSGLLILPDFNNSFLAIRAEKIVAMQDVSSKKKAKADILTTGNHNYSVESRFKDFQPAYESALGGAHVSLWSGLQQTSGGQGALNKKPAPTRRTRTLKIMGA